MGSPWILFLLFFFGLRATAQTADPTRLSSTVEPRFQNIHLTIDPRVDSYTGDVAIDVTTSIATDSIRLHGEEFHVQQATIDGMSGLRPAVAVFREHGYLVLKSAEILPPGRYTVRLRFGGKYRSGPQGINKFQRDSLDYICTQMESIYGRSAFPCFDEPHFKILYQVSLTVPEGMFAASNMPVSSEVRSAGFRTVVFDTTRPTPSYLLAFVVGPYDTMAVPGTPIPVRLIGPRGFLKERPLVAKHLPRVIRALEDHAGFPFPFPKLDLAYVSGFGGMAMENSGLIILTESHGDHDDPERTVFQDRMALFVTAHEIAHMWLGDLVTLDWWDDIWLNEGLTEWLSKVVMEELFPQLANEEDIKNDFSFSRDNDVGSTIQAVVRSFRGDENVDASWTSQASLSYSKPNVVLRMVEGWVGRPLLIKTIQTYLRAHRYRTVKTGDFLAAIHSVAGPEAAGILSDYVYRPGIPTVLFERRGGDSLAVRQQRYRGLNDSSAGEGLWRIPITLWLRRGGREWKQRFLVTGRDTVVRLPGSGPLTLLVPNAGQAGYYMSRIPQDLTEALLRAQDRPLREREDLLANILHYSRAGEISPVEIIELGERIHPSSDTALVSMWLRLLNSLKDTYMLGARDTLFRPFFEAQALPVLERTGYAPLPGENENVPERRWNARELLFHLEDVHRNFAKVARGMLADPERVLTFNESRYLNNLAFDEGSDSLQSAALERLVRSNNDEERRVFAGMAAYHRGEAAMRKNIEFVLSPAPSATERLVILQRIDRTLRRANDTLGHRQYMRWVHEHESALRPMVQLDWFEMFFLAGLAWTMDEVPLFEELFPPGRYSRGFQEDWKSNIESMKQASMLRKRYGSALHEYLAARNARR